MQVMKSNSGPFTRLRDGLLPNRYVWMHRLFVLLFSATPEENCQGYVKAVLLRFAAR